VHTLIPTGYHIRLCIACKIGDTQIRAGKGRRVEILPNTRPTTGKMPLAAKRSENVGLAISVEVSERKILYRCARRS
jgi:hypothetical protein